MSDITLLDYIAIDVTREAYSKGRRRPLNKTVAAATGASESDASQRLKRLKAASLLPVFRPPEPTKQKLARERRARAKARQARAS